MEKVNSDIKDFLYYMIHNKSLTRFQQARRDYLLARDSGCIINDNVNNKNNTKHEAKKQVEYIQCPM